MAAKTVKINEGFTCGHCGELVPPALKTCRNHCRSCLWSLHVDGDVPGDRAGGCSGLMEPLRVEKNKKGLVVVHKCTVCGMYRRNCVLEDDCWDMVIELSMF